MRAGISTASSCRIRMGRTDETRRGSARLIWRADHASSSRPRLDLHVAEHDGTSHRAGQHLVREAEIDGAHVVEALALIGGEGNVQGTEIILELLQGAGTDDWAGDRGVEQGP